MSAPGHLPGAVACGPLLLFAPCADGQVNALRTTRWSEIRVVLCDLAAVQRTQEMEATAKRAKLPRTNPDLAGNIACVVYAAHAAWCGRKQATSTSRDAWLLHSVLRRAAEFLALPVEIEMPLPLREMLATTDELMALCVFSATTMLAALLARRRDEDREVGADEARCVARVLAKKFAALQETVRKAILVGAAVRAGEFLVHCALWVLIEELAQGEALRTLAPSDRIGAAAAARWWGAVVPKMMAADVPPQFKALAARWPVLLAGHAARLSAPAPASASTPTP